MGIFTRLKDIVNANFNSMLDKAEDPEKMIKLMIREMEDTLVEIKASCAGAMATEKRISRDMDKVKEKVTLWGNRAELAIQRGKEDLAREALLEKRRFQEGLDREEEQLENCKLVIQGYKEDIQQLEEKLIQAREKHRVLVERQIRAINNHKAQNDIRKMETTNAWKKFEMYENRIEQMEAEAELINAYRTTSKESMFQELETDDQLEAELNELKAKVKNVESKVN